MAKNNGDNQLTNVTRSGTLTVSGNTSSTSTNVTVNGQAANLYADLLFAKDGFTLTNGTNTFTAIAQNAAGAANTNTISVYLPATNAFTFDANGNPRCPGSADPTRKGSHTPCELALRMAFGPFA